MGSEIAPSSFRNLRYLKLPTMFIKKIITRLAFVTTILGAVSLMACTTTPVAPPTSATINHSHSATASPTSGQVLYQFDWHWGKAQPDTDGKGWTVINDLGYQIHVTQGYLVTGSAELVPCAHTHAQVQPSTIDTIAALFAPQIAKAGHGGESDASRLKNPQVESLTVPQSISAITQWGSEPNYCQMHYLVAYGVANAQNLPTDVSMIGNSLLIEGEVRAPNTTVATPFNLKSALAWGGSKDLIVTNDKTDVAEGVKSGTFLHLIVSRDLGSLFDGVDFAQMSAQDQSKQILRSIIQNTEIEVHCK